MADAIYEIKYAVDRETPKVTPTAAQKAGYYGDDKAAQLMFSGVDKTLKYQIEIVDGNGAYDITDTLTPNSSGQIVFFVPSAWTAAGLASVRLVEIGNHVLHYPEVHLLFEARESGDQMGEMLPRWQSVMRDAETATDDANCAADRASKAATSANDAAADARASTPNIKGGVWYLGDKNTGIPVTGPKGEKGDADVYVGSGDMPAEYNVQIDPDGEVIDIDKALDGKLSNTHMNENNIHVADINGLREKCMEYFNALANETAGRYVIARNDGAHFFVDIYRTSELWGVIKLTSYIGADSLKNSFGARILYASVYEATKGDTRGTLSEFVEVTDRLKNLEARMAALENNA